MYDDDDDDEKTMDDADLDSRSASHSGRKGVSSPNMQATCLDTELIPAADGQSRHNSCTGRYC